MKRLSTMSSGSKPSGQPAPAEAIAATEHAARAERVEDPQERAALHHPHRTEVVVRQQRLRAVAGDDQAEALGDQVECGLPGDALEPPLALRTDAAQRVEQPVGRIGARLVVVHLGAEHAPGERMVLGAAHGRDPSVLHLGHPGTGILAVQRAAALDVAELTHRLPPAPRPTLAPEPSDTPA
jgi:hypothetical protein